MKGSEIIVKSPNGESYKPMRVKRIIHTFAGTYCAIDRDYFNPEKQIMMFAGVNLSDHFECDLQVVEEALNLINERGLKLKDWYGYRLIDAIVCGEMVVENIYHDLYVLVNVRDVGF